MFQALQKIFDKKSDSSIYPTVFDDSKAAFEEIERVGFAVIKLMDNYFHNEFYEESKAFVDELEKNKIIEPFLSVGRLENSQIRNFSKELVKKYLDEKLALFFNPLQYEIIFGTHLLKKNNKNSILNPHQDSSHVDETLYSTYHIWIPVSVPSFNFGTLEVIPYSHKLNIPFRSLNIPWSLSEHENNLWKFMKKIHITSGHAIVFDSKLIHGSGINRTNNIRIAANSLIKPKSADFIHCYSDNKTNFQKIELYKITPDFYYNENIMEKPKGYTLLKTVENSNQKYSLKELEIIFNNSIHHAF